MTKYSKDIGFLSNLYVLIKPCDVAYKKNDKKKDKFTFDVTKYSQDIGLILKVFNKNKSDFKLCIILLKGVRVRINLGFREKQNLNQFIEL